MPNSLIRALKSGLIPPPAPGNFRGYHGSPYTFDVFDPAHIGKGEGFQAYGMGGYLAQSPYLAHDYWKHLGGMVVPSHVDLGKTIRPTQAGDYVIPHGKMYPLRTRGEKPYFYTNFDTKDHPSPQDADRFGLVRSNQSWEQRVLPMLGQTLNQSQDAEKTFKKLKATLKNRLERAKAAQEKANIEYENWANVDTEAHPNLGEMPQRVVERAVALDEEVERLTAVSEFFDAFPNAEFVKQHQIGRRYVVDVEGDKDQLLNWDKPLYKQTREVQNQLLEAANEVDSLPGNYGRDDHNSVLDYIDRGMDKTIPWVEGRGGDAVTGGHAYKAIMDGIEDADLVKNWRSTWGRVDRSKSQRNAGMEASNMLSDQGMPGISYLDGRSRKAGEGTSNYVIFPNEFDRMKIVAKYGLMPAAAGMSGLSEEEEPENAQQQLMRPLQGLLSK